MDTGGFEPPTSCTQSRAKHARYHCAKRPYIIRGHASSGGALVLCSECQLEADFASVASLKIMILTSSLMRCLYICHTVPIVFRSLWNCFAGMIGAI